MIFTKLSSFIYSVTAFLAKQKHPKGVFTEYSYASLLNSIKRTGKRHKFRKFRRLPVVFLYGFLQSAAE